MWKTQAFYVQRNIEVPLFSHSYLEKAKSITNSESACGLSYPACTKYFITSMPQAEKVVANFKSILDTKNDKVKYLHVWLRGPILYLSCTANLRLLMCRSAVYYSRSLNCVDRLKQEDWDGQDMWHVWGEERCIQGFSGETWGKETTWKTQA